MSLTLLGLYPFLLVFGLRERAQCLQEGSFGISGFYGEEFAWPWDAAVDCEGATNPYSLIL